MKAKEIVPACRLVISFTTTHTIVSFSLHFERKIDQVEMLIADVSVAY